MTPARHPITIIPAPAAWASYLVNNDDSGLLPGERDQVDAWRRREGVEILDVARNDSGEISEPYFSKAWRVLVPESPYDAGDLLDYVAREITIDLDREGATP